jgi:excisionase family DNA binding protein
MARQGQLPAFKVGGDWRFSRDVLIKWMARGGSQRVRR